MRIGKKTVLIYLSIGFVILSLSACKELENLSLGEETAEEPAPAESTNPTTGNNASPTSGHEDGTTEYHGHFEENRNPINLNSLKINGANVNFEIANGADPWNITNNKPVVLGVDQINQVEIDLNAQNEASHIYFLELRIRSLTDAQTVFMSLGDFNVNKDNVELTDNFHFNAYYENYRQGIFSDVYGGPMDHGGHQIGSTGLSMNSEGLFSVNQTKITFNISDILAHFHFDQYDYNIAHDHAMDTASTGTMASNDQIAPMFNKNDLFSVSLYIDGEVYYQNTLVNNVFNCVFSANDSPPTDIDDICHAYLSMYK